MTMTSRRPYLIRAMYDWITDNEMTPFLLVNAESADADVPMAYVEDGRIILDISPRATRGLLIENDRIIFTAKFGGIPTQVSLAPYTVMAIYCKETNDRMEFEDEEPPPPPKDPSSAGRVRGKPKLRLVKS